MRTTFWVIFISFIVTCYSFTTLRKHPTRQRRFARDNDSKILPILKNSHPSPRMTESLSTTAMAAGTDGDNVPTKIGFIGCGTIAVAIATGIATQSKIAVESIVVSKRSESKSKRLAETFPDLVRVEEDNQKIIDEADLIFLCVLPELASEVLKGLSFDNDRHTLVSLVVRAFIFVSLAWSLERIHFVNWAESPFKFICCLGI